MQNTNNIDDEYENYWNTNMMKEVLDSHNDEEISVGYYDSSSPDGTTQSSSPPHGTTQPSSPASKNIASEKRRQNLNETLYALRAVVPNITKLDKASTVKDAIEYVQFLHDEERRIQAEISEMESAGRPSSSSETFNYMDHGHNKYDTTNLFSLSNQRRTRSITGHRFDSSSAPSTLIMPSSPTQLLELRVSSMGRRIIVVSLTCSNRTTDTMAKICEIFESLSLKIITANITVFYGRLLNTVFLEGDEEEKEALNLNIRAAIAALNDPEADSPIPMSI